MNNEPKRRVALSLLAHPDDAEMLCAGTLIRLSDAGWEVHIATVANGDCGSATLSREEIASVRRREGIAAAAKIGATYHCVDEPDVHVVCDQRTIQQVIDLLRRVAPTLLFTHPRHDYMLDHSRCICSRGLRHSVTRSPMHRRCRSSTGPPFLGYTIAIPWRVATHIRVSL